MNKSSVNRTTNGAQSAAPAVAPTPLNPATLLGNPVRMFPAPVDEPLNLDAASLPAYRTASPTRTRKPPVRIARQHTRRITRLGSTYRHRDRRGELHGVEQRSAASAAAVPGSGYFCRRCLPIPGQSLSTWEVVAVLRHNGKIYCVPKVFPCYSPPDRKLVHELAALRAWRWRGSSAGGRRDAARRGPHRQGAEGLSSDVVLVLLSPSAVPARWILDRWQSVFWTHAAEVGTPVAALLCETCKFPDLLRRKIFFDLP